MAEVLKEFPTIKRSGRKPKHPYPDWFKKGETKNGVRLVKGKDFDSQVKTVRHNLYREKNKRGIDIKTVVEGDTIALKVLVPEKGNKKTNK